MSINWKAVAAGVATIAALSTGTALHAQADKPETSGGMMMRHGSSDMKDMTDMMGQMSRMMESCNKMMQDMSSSKGAEKPATKAAPQKSQ